MNIFNNCIFNKALFLIIFLGIIVNAKCSPPHKKRLKQIIPCIEEGKYYRNPKRLVHKMWSSTECAKYFACVDSEVIEFTCADGLLFDVIRQICDFKQNVDNCDVTEETKIPKPLLKDAKCDKKGRQLGCGDGSCLPSEYFCDGSVDCPDGSDEGWCDLQNDPNGAPECDPIKCQLPHCHCSKDGTDIPGNLNSKQVPQMIILTFDDSVNFDNWELFSKILMTQNRRNPNGCPIKGTFYITHQYTNYQFVQKLWNDGHEIAVHSITHRDTADWWSYNATIEDWFDEMVGQANILNKFANIRMDEIRGIRVPYQKVGWNRQFLMMKEFGFVYDSSVVAPLSNPPLWPYTMDYKMPHSCLRAKQNCPTRSYPGIWEMIINQMEGGDYTCGTIDTCPSHFDGEDIYRMLSHNFKRHYLTNRAPFGLYFESTWFKKIVYLNAFLKFMEDIQKLPDVYFVTNFQAIQWMRNPTPVNELHDFEPWDCNEPKDLNEKEIACEVPNVCKVHSKILQEEKYFHTCSECPPNFPWIRNEFGLY